MKRLRALGILMISAKLFGQGAPIVGSATIHGTASPSTVANGSLLQLSVTVDLTGVSGTGSGGTTPAVLGGYQIAIAFDNTKLQFVSANGGSAVGFNTAPAYTNTTTANAQGQVSISAAQTNASAPAGVVQVANLSFKALSLGPASLSLTGQSLSSAFQPPSFLPTAISSSGSTANLTISGGPAAPTDLLPADGATGVSAPVTLSWTGSSDAESYEVYFGTTSPPPLVQSTSSTALSVSTATGTVYFWRVVAVNGAGSASSPTNRFTTSGTAPCVKPAAPVLTGPSTAVSGKGITLTWNAIGGATEYRVDESTDAAFASPTTAVVQAPSETATFTHVVSHDTTYYYRITAVIGGSCNLSSVFSNSVAVVVTPSSNAKLRVIPVVASTAGSLGSFFKTAAQFFNPGSSSLKGTLTFHPAGRSASASDPSLWYDIPPGETVHYDDLVAAMHASGIGSLDITTDSTFPGALFRVYNDGGSLGSTGFGEELLSSDDALTTDQTTVLFAPSDPIAARFNIGVRTLSESVTIEVTWRSPTGAVLKTLTKNYPADYFIQSTDASFLESTSSLSANDSVVIVVKSGALFVYGALTDNKTQDPTMQVGRKVR